MPTFKFSVLELVDNHLIQAAKKDCRNNQVFHPSEWDGCHRKIAYQYYQAVGAIKLDACATKVDTKLQRIFSNGHWMHDRWRSYLENCSLFQGRWMCKNFMGHSKPKIYGDDNTLGIPKPEKCDCGSTQFEYVELGFYDEETNWGGHVDTIMKTDIPEYPHVLIDYKTMNPFEFSKLEAPKPAHKTQMQIYLYLSGLKMGKFLYENKGDQSVKEFDVPVDESFLAKKKEEALLLKHLVTHKNSKGQRVLPPRPPGYIGKGHKVCMACKFRAHCWR